MRIQQKWYRYNQRILREACQAVVSEERKFGRGFEKNEMKFARFWNWILFETTLGRGINDWDNDFSILLGKANKIK